MSKKIDADLCILLLIIYVLKMFILNNFLFFINSTLDTLLSFHLMFFNFFKLVTAELLMIFLNNK